MNVSIFTESVGGRFLNQLWWIIIKRYYVLYIYYNTLGHNVLIEKLNAFGKYIM